MPHSVMPALDGDGPIWQQIRRALADPILNGEWPPGTRIPTEAFLSDKFGISRMTASKAVQQLVTDGLVHRHRKVGTLADAEHKISARGAPPEVATELQVAPDTACLVVDRRTWNESTPVTLARLWHPGSQHSLVGHFRSAR